MCSGVNEWIVHPQGLLSFDQLTLTDASVHSKKATQAPLCRLEVEAGQPVLPTDSTTHLFKNPGCQFTLKTCVRVRAKGCPRTWVYRHKLSRSFVLEDDKPC